MKKFRIIFFSMTGCQICKNLKAASHELIEEIKKNKNIQFTEHIIENKEIKNLEEKIVRDFEIMGFKIKQVPVIVFTEYDDSDLKNEENQTILKISKNEKNEFLIVVDQKFETFKKNYEDFLEIIAEAN